MGFTTTYPKLLVKIEEVWYEAKTVDYEKQEVTLKSLDGVFKFSKIQEFRVIWEGQKMLLTTTITMVIAIICLIKIVRLEKELNKKIDRILGKQQG